MTDKDDDDDDPISISQWQYWPIIIIYPFSEDPEVCIWADRLIGTAEIVFIEHPQIYVSVERSVVDDERMQLLKARGRGALRDEWAPTGGYRQHR